MISIWENSPEQLSERGVKYTNRAVQAIKDPTGLENAKNIYFGLIMGVSAALPSCSISFSSFPRFSKVKKRKVLDKRKIQSLPIDRLPNPIIFSTMTS